MSSETKKHPGEQRAGTIDIPEVMHAAAIDRCGGPEFLTLHRLPVPTVGKVEVLIAIDTAGVGRWDAEMRDGWYPGGPPDFPLVLGTDGSGKVVAMGSHVRRLKLGEACTLTALRIPRADFMRSMWPRTV